MIIQEMPEDFPEEKIKSHKEEITIPSLNKQFDSMETSCGFIFYINKNNNSLERRAALRDKKDEVLDSIKELIDYSFDKEHVLTVEVEMGLPV